MRRVFLGWALACAAQAGEPVTDDECLEFAQVVEREIRSRDVGRINRLVDWDAILARVTAPIGEEVSPKFVKGFLHGVKESLAKNGGAMGTVALNVARGGDYTFLRIVERSGRRALRFRYIEASGAVNYNDLLLARSADGVRVDGIYHFSSSELVATGMRRLFVAAAVSDNAALRAGLTGAQSEFVKSLPAIRKATAALKAKNSAEAMSHLQALPASIRDDKSMLVLRARAARGIGRNELDAVIATWRRLHPADASPDLLMLEVFIGRDPAEIAFAAIDRIEKAVGGDPYLHALRARVHLRAGNLAAALAAARRAVREDPDLGRASWMLMVLEVRAKNHAEVARLFTILADRFGYDVEGLKENKLLADFVKSPEYAAWLKSRTKK